MGSAQPGESATEAPNASAARRIVPRFPGSPTRQSDSDDRVDAPRQRLASEERHHPGRMPHRRDLGQQLGLDVFAGAEDLDRIDARVVGRLHEILALDDEQPLPVALAARLEQPMDQPQLRIRR